jgi:hypothetical protein
MEEVPVSRDIRDIRDEPFDAEEDALQEKVFETGLALEEAAAIFIEHHPFLRGLDCPTTSALVLAVDRFTDAHDELHRQLDTDHEEGRNAT